VPQRRRIEAYLGRLFGYALSMAGDRDQARDLVQDCALRALAARRVPEDEAAYRAWLFRILRNAFLDEERRNGRRGHDGAETDGLPGPGEIWDFDQRLISELTVRVGLAKLTGPHREVIALVDIGGFSYAEAAHLIGVAPGTVMSRLSRARHALLRAIGEGNVQPLPRPEKRMAK